MACRRSHCRSAACRIKRFADLPGSVETLSAEQQAAWSRAIARCAARRVSRRVGESFRESDTDGTLEIVMATIDYQTIHGALQELLMAASAVHTVVTADFPDVREKIGSWVG